MHSGVSFSGSPARITRLWSSPSPSPARFNFCTRGDFFSLFRLVARVCYYNCDIERRTEEKFVGRLMLLWLLHGGRRDVGFSKFG